MAITSGDQHAAPALDARSEAAVCHGGAVALEQGRAATSSGDQHVDQVLDEAVASHDGAVGLERGRAPITSGDQHVDARDKVLLSVVRLAVEMEVLEPPHTGVLLDTLLAQLMDVRDVVQLDVVPPVAAKRPSTDGSSLGALSDAVARPSGAAAPDPGRACGALLRIRLGRDPTPSQADPGIWVYGAGAPSPRTHRPPTARGSHASAGAATLSGRGGNPLSTAEPPRRGGGAAPLIQETTENPQGVGCAYVPRGLSE